MKKPINKFAIGLWGAAAAVLVSHLIQTWEMWQSVADLAVQGGEGAFVFKTLLSIANTMAFTAGSLVGLGALIELVDQIRWNVLPKDR